MTKQLVLAADEEHYRRLGLTREIRPFEDGLRTDPARAGHYEWWYLDAHLDDGARLVVTFLTKEITHPVAGAAPMVIVDLTLPDGTAVSRSTRFPASEFRASEDRCDVTVGANHFAGDLHDYTVHVALEDLTVYVELSGITEPWRPETGHILYGTDEAEFFAWLPAVPYGNVRATYRAGEATATTGGTGYHDHNWGNVALPRVVNNWYWGRGTVGPYTFITAQIIAERAFGYQPAAVFMLARDGKVIADDVTRVSFTKSGVHTDAEVGKPVADVHSFMHRDGDEAFTVTYNRSETLVRARMAESLHGWKRLAARAGGFDGAYLRFGGTVRVRHEKARQVVEELEGPAMWELMYFGKHRHDAD